MIRPASLAPALAVAALVAVTGCGHPLTARHDGTLAAAPPLRPRTVLFIHGMFMTSSCWDAWRPRFEAAGYRTLAPAWPLHDPPAAAQRARHPDAALGRLTLDDVVEHYARIIATLDDKPILVGHSMGGLIVQLLLQRGLGVAGVAIDSAPPKGVISLEYSFLKSNWPVLSPFVHADEPVLLTPQQFGYAFAQTMTPAELQAAYDAQVVPESRRVGRGPTTRRARIDYRGARGPLLLVAGGADHIIPPRLNWSNYDRQRQSPGLTEFREFPGRTHYTLAQPGWEEVADFVLGWLHDNVYQR